MFNAPQAGVNKQSPLKLASQNSSSPLRVPFANSNKLTNVTMPPPGGPRFNTDSMEKRQPVMSKFKPQKALFTNFNTQTPIDQENVPHQYYQAPANPYSEGLNRANFSLEGLYGQRPIQKKRTLLEAAPIHESRPLKKTRMMEESEMKDELPMMKELPDPSSFEPLHDDGSKPTHSYAQLIGMSILRAQNRRLTLAQIYKWISDTYSFYGATDAGWQNSIRHNLSLNKAFVKQERPKDDPGKGNYWAIEPGMEHQFIKEKPQVRKSTNQLQSTPILPSNTPHINQPEVVQFKTPALPPTPEQLPASQKQYTSLPEPTHLDSIQELSSDATIPASDALLTDPEDETNRAAPSSPLIQSSPPTALMNSSPPPPLSRPSSKRNDTPPPVPRFHSSSRSRSHQRKYASMDDSGYFSSLDSSAMRPHRLLSDADRPRIKRGRAEEEIARLRGSSYDSPTKNRTSFAPASSSPLRIRQNFKAETSQMLPPLTPAVKLRAPVRPPPSVSPNTNLRMHRDRVREMVGSPLRGMTVLEENQSWSPAFHLDEMNSGYMFSDFAPDFDIFADPGSFLSVPGNGSPEKRSARRPRMDRSKSATILADISNPNLNKAFSSTPVLKLTPSGQFSFSPMKNFGLMESPSKMLSMESPSKIGNSNFNLGAFDLSADDFYGSEFLEEDLSGGWDIMQGFQKIGGSNQTNRGTPKQVGRPSLGRSFTSRF